jgi:non-homologous end joining protein Ku
MLVNAQRATFDAAKLKDKFKQRVVESHPESSGGSGRRRSRSATTAPVVDIMDALRRSLEATRKPPQSEANERSPGKKNKKHMK